MRNQTGLLSNRCLGGVSVLLWFTVLVEPVAAQQMVFPGADWEEATPESVLIDSADLAAAVSYLQSNAPFNGANELVVIRNGRMIWKGSNVDRVHQVWSVTKSFTSTVLGLLIDDGKTTLDTLAQDHVPSMADLYPTVRLRHFATMTSGYRAPGENPPSYHSATPLTPANPLFTPPGSQYAYWDTAMTQFGNALTQIAEEPMEDFFHRRIADPIGMDPSRWDWGQLAVVNGTSLNGPAGINGISISAREVARFGHLFLNRGQWDGQQLISSAWVDEATSPQVPSTIPMQPQNPTNVGPGVYGYNWWANGVLPNGSRSVPGATNGTYYASGMGNNKVFVIPEWNTVVVRLGLDDAVYGGFRIPRTTWGPFLDRLSSAGSMAVWDEAGDGTWGDIDPTSDAPRWLHISGNRSAIYPDDPIAGAIVKTDTVSVDTNRTIRELVVESGGIVISPSAVLGVVGNTLVDEQGTFTVSGTLNAASLTTAGSASVDENGNASVSDGVHVAPSGELYVTGTLNASSVTTSGTTTIAEGSLGAVDRIEVTGGTMRLPRFDVETVNVAGGILDLTTDATGLSVNGGTVNMSGGVSIASLEMTAGTINLSDGDLVVTRANVDGGTLNTGAYNLLVREALTIDDKRTIAISEGTFTISSPDVGDLSAADELIVSGGTLTIGGRVIAPTGAIGIWEFEEGVGPVTTDQSLLGNNHPGDLVGPSWANDVDGHGIVLSFDGDDYMEVANAADVDLGSPFTVAMWIKTSQKGGKLLGKGFGDRGTRMSERDLYIDPADGHLALVGPLGARLNGTTDLTDDCWHHVVVTYADSTSPGGQEIYVDGVNDTATRFYSGGLDSNPVFRLGWAETKYGSGYQDYVGLMDDVYLYDRSLSAGEAADLYESFGAILDPMRNTHLRVTADTTLHLETVSQEAVLGDLTLDAGVTLKVAGAVAVFNNVTAGNGSSIEGDLSVAGILSPGDSPGTLTVTGDLEMEGSSTYQWELGASTTDLVSVTGDLDLAEGWTLQLHDVGGTCLASDQLDLFTYNGLLTWGECDIDASQVEGFGHWDWSSAIVEHEESRVYLTGLTVVPEPRTLLLLLSGGVGLVLHIWRRGLRRTAIVTDVRDHSPFNCLPGRS